MRCSPGELENFGYGRIGASDWIRKKGRIREEEENHREEEKGGCGQGMSVREDRECQWTGNVSTMLQAVQNCFESIKGFTIIINNTDNNNRNENIKININNTIISNTFESNSHNNNNDFRAHLCLTAGYTLS